MAEDEDVTRLLSALTRGDEDAAGKLIPAVYDELRRLAGSYMRRERTDHTLQATALVHELYLRLLQQKKISWEDRRHFYVFAAQSMRRILIDHARSQQAQSRGGGFTPVPLHEALAWVEIGSPELMELDRALEELQLIAPAKVRLVEMRYFLGCTAEETAALLGVSKATVDRELRFIKAWLFQRLHPGAPPPRDEDD